MIAVTTNPDGVPLYLAQLDRWVLWREMTRINSKTKERRTTKVPIGYRAGKDCDITNPLHWASFADVTAAMDRTAGIADGLGVVLGDTGQGEWIIGADLDECLDDDEAISPWAIDTLTILRTYTDKSPGGRGLKPIARIRAADVAEVRKLLGLAENEFTRAKILGEKTNGHHAPGVVLYLGKRFFTVTGRPWQVAPEDVTLLSLDQIARLAHWFGRKATPSASPGQRADDDETEPEAAELRDKLGVAFRRNPGLKARWEGGTAGLSDTSRSGFDMSIVGMLIAANFSRGDIHAALHLFQHGKLDEEEAAGTGDRYFDRMWTRSVASPRVEPEPPPDWEERYPPIDVMPTGAGFPDDQPDDEPGPDRDPDDDPYEGLSECLAAGSWLQRTTQPVTRLLGNLISSTTRAFIVGRTGLGKTLLGLAFAVGMASGVGFLHWRSSRPARVLYIDGEMPTDLLIERIQDAAERIDRLGLIDNLMVFSLEDSEAIAERWPMLGVFEPLNTEEGQNFLKRLCTALRPDVIIFDNVQALLAGVQKEEETWIPVLPLVTWLTKQYIGQLWFDHTGHNADRQYGTAVKAWRFDVVGILTPVSEEEREQHETAFTLSFDHPGKARRRTPANWLEFATHIIRLRNGQWTGEPADSEAATRKRLKGKVKPSTRLFHDALLSAIAAAATGPGQTAMFAWEIECIRKGLLDTIETDDDAATRAKKRAKLRTAKSDLQAAGMIGINGDRVSDLCQRW
jgi:KaiC/GvpD/RAD55 family RecA-like ATPase